MTNIFLPTAGSISSSQGGNITAYYWLGSAGLDLGTNTYSEAESQTTWRDGGTFSNLYCSVSINNFNPGGASTLNYRVGGGNGNQTVSITASTTGEFSDATHTDAVSSGNQVNYQAVTPAAFSGGLGINTFGIQFAPTTTANTVNKLSCCGTLTDTSLNTSYYNPLTGLLSKTSTETNAQFKNKTTATLQNLYTYVTANTASIAALNTEVAAATPGNLTISVGSGVTGALEDTTHTDSISSGTLVNTQFKSTVTTSVTLTIISVDYLTTNGATHYITGTGAGYNDSFTGLTDKFSVTGNMQRQGAGQVLQFKTGLAFTSSNLEAFIIANTITANSIITFQKASSNGNETITYGSGVTGYLEDTTHTDAVTASTEINYACAIGASGTSITFGNIGILASYVNIYNNSLTETLTSSDTEVATASDVPKLTETVTSSDTETGKASDTVSLTETTTSSDSYAVGKITSNPLTETITSSDSEIINATDVGLATETVTSSDSESGVTNNKPTLSETIISSDSEITLAIAVTILTESSTASDAENGLATFSNGMTETIVSSDNQVGVANDNVALSESETSSDSYVLVGNQIYNNSITESLTSSDVLGGMAIMSDGTTENLTANDNYNSGEISGAIQSAITGPSDGNNDPRQKYLKWLKQKKLKQLKIASNREGMTQYAAAQLVEKAVKETEKHINKEVIQQEVQKAVLAVYEKVWEQMVRDELARQQYQAEMQEIDDEEAFLMMM